MKHLLISLFLLSSCTVAKEDMGGSITEYMAKAQNYTRELPKTCASACTYFLYRGCVTTDHTLLFHSPRLLVGGLSVPMPAERFERETVETSKYYPPEIAKAYLEEWRYEFYGYVEITGQQAIDMGARECD